MTATLFTNTPGTSEFVRQAYDELGGVRSKPEEVLKRAKMLEKEATESLLKEIDSVTGDLLLSVGTMREHRTLVPILTTFTSIKDWWNTTTKGYDFIDVYEVDNTLGIECRNRTSVTNQKLYTLNRNIEVDMREGRTMQMLIADWIMAGYLSPVKPDIFENFKQEVKD